MGKGRFLYDDLSPTTSQFTASSVRDGQVGLSVKSGTGSAVGLAGGAYTGSADLQYRVEIDSIAGGAEVGQSTFRWRDGSIIGWNASGVLTSAAPVTLNNGVTMKWTTGAGADFVVGDRWDFLTAAFFGFRQLLDRDPDTGFRSKALASPEWIRRDLGAATRITACLIDVHNLTSAATVALKANATDAWGAPSYSVAIPWAAGPMLVYLDQTYRYWRLEITDPSNPDGYVRCKWFLGTYLELLGNYDRGWAQDRVATETIIKTDAGARRHLVQSAQDELTISYRLMAAADEASLRGLEAYAHDVINLKSRPLWFNRDSDTPANTFLGTIPARIKFASPYLGRTEVASFVFQGLPRTAR